MRRAVVFAAAVAAATSAWVGPAGADPRNSNQITLECGDAGTVTVNTFSNGRWSPGLAADGTAVFVPTAFGEFSGVFYPADGSDPETFTDPPALKSAPNNKAPKLSCTFSFSFTDEHGTGMVSGSVIGFATPAKG